MAANNKCYLAVVTRDANGNITKVVPYNPNKKVAQGATVVGVKTGAQLTSPLILIGAGLLLGILVLGGKKNE